MKLAGVQYAIGFRPARSGDAVIGKFVGDQLVPDATHAQQNTLAEPTAERGVRLRWVFGEELLHSRG